MQNAKLCTTASDVPKTEHWAIIRFGTRFIPGVKTLDWDSTEDETVATSEYWAFSSKSDWEAEVATLTRNGNNTFVAIVAKPATVTLTVSVE
jgi:hypothetical protein